MRKPRYQSSKKKLDKKNQRRIDCKIVLKSLQNFIIEKINRTSFVNAGVTIIINGDFLPCAVGKLQENCPNT